MPKFAANLTMLYTDSPFLDRFERAKASGFRYVGLEYIPEGKTESSLGWVREYGLAL